MTQQAKDILLQVAADTETMYNQGVLDGITLIKNMLSEKLEDGTEWTIDLITETCDAFIEKYTNSEDGLPDIPNLVDEIPVPEEAAEAGMTSDDYGDLMAFLNENTETPQEEEKEPEIIPLDKINGMIVEDSDDYEKYANNNFVVEEEDPHVPIIIEENNGVTVVPSVASLSEEYIEDIKTPVTLDNPNIPVHTSPFETTMDTLGLEGAVSMDIEDVLANAVIRTDDGEEIKLSDCVAEVSE